MNRRYLLLLLLAVPLAFAWWSALMPAVAVSARCAGVTLPWDTDPNAAPCPELSSSLPARGPAQTYNSPTRIPTTTPSGATNTPVAGATATGTPTQTQTPTGQTATPTQTGSPTQTFTPSATAVPGATNTPTGSPSPTRTNTPPAGAASPTSTATRAAIVPTNTSPPAGPPTATVGLPRTGDGSLSGGGPSGGMLLVGGVALAFVGALLWRARASQT
jgi:hypothetical protein